jgi:hypothetical protein
MNTATMNLFAIDTLQFSKRMQKAGLKKETADELAEAIKETQSQSFENVATKQDLLGLENSLKKDMQILEHNILLKVGKIIYVSTGLIIAMMGLAVAIIKI